LQRPGVKSGNRQRRADLNSHYLLLGWRKLHHCDYRNQRLRNH
jgi:hypothetical protein